MAFRCGNSLFSFLFFGGGGGKASSCDHKVFSVIIKMYRLFSISHCFGFCRFTRSPREVFG